MRVLMLSCDFLPNPGGVSGHVYELARALALSGIEVDLVAGHSQKGASLELPELPKGLRILKSYYFNRDLPWERMFSWWTIHKLVQEARAQGNYDLVHWHNLKWESVAVKTSCMGLPKVFTNHSSGFLKRMTSTWRRKWMLPWLVKTADQLIAPSDELLEQSLRLDFPADKGHYIPNGVDVDLFRPCGVDLAMRSSFGISPEARVLVVPRRLDPKNGVDVLIRALPAVLKSHSQLRVLLIGDGSERTFIENLARELGVYACLVFAGSQTRFDMPRFLCLGEVMILPSRKEAVSLAGLEAMACGLPVIGSAVGGIPQFVEPGVNGDLFPSENHEQLAACILKWLNAPAEERKQIAEQARASVIARYTWLQAAQKTIAVYQKAIGKA
jgi:glycosyltransferase involved in cell wall biosynthesis